MPQPVHGLEVLLVCGFSSVATSVHNFDFLGLFSFVDIYSPFNIWTSFLIIAIFSVASRV